MLDINTDSRSEIWQEYFISCNERDFLKSFDALVKLGMRPLPVGEDPSTGKIKIPLGKAWGKAELSARRESLVHYLSEGVPVGIGCQPDGFLVVDIDPTNKDRRNLPDAWKAAASILLGREDWPETLIIKTQAGCHVWFELTPELRAVWKEGNKLKIELPGGHGHAELFTGGRTQTQVACPPSEGKEISLAREPQPVPPPLEAVIKEVLEGKKNPVPKNPSVLRTPLMPPSESAVDWWSGRLERLRLKVMNADEGARHDTYRACVRTMAGYSATLNLTDKVDSVFAVLSEAHREAKPEVSDYILIATFNWAWSKGLESPLEVAMPKVDKTYPERSNRATVEVLDPFNPKDMAPLASEIVQKVHMRVDQGLVYLYDTTKGYYREDTERYQQILIRSLLNWIERNTEHEGGDSDLKFNLTMLKELDALVRCFLTERQINRKLDINPLGIVNVANGLLNWATGELSEHTPDVFTTRQTCWSWTDSQEPPVRLLEFLGSILGIQGEQNPDLLSEIAIIQEYMGYILSGSNEHHKILLLLGPPRSGKGTLLSVISELTGPDSFLPMTPSVLLTQFGLQRAIGKRVLAFPDLRVNGVSADRQATIVESLLSLSANDPQFIDRKFLSQWYGRPNLALIVATNYFPRLSDDSSAMANRFLPVSTKTSFLGNEDLSLLDSLLEELPLIARWAWKGYQKLRERRQFLKTSTTDQQISELHDLGNPLAVFARECIERDTEGGMVSNAELYERYLKWVEENGLKPMNSISFGKRLKETVSWRYTTGLERYNGKVQRVAKGIMLKVENLPY